MGARTGAGIDFRKNCQLQTQMEPSTGENRQSQALTRKDAHCISYKKSTTSATLPVRNHRHPKLMVFSHGLSFKTTAPNFPLLLVYKISVPLLCWTCLWFCRSFHVPSCNSLLFPNKLTFPDKITVSFLGLTIPIFTIRYTHHFVHIHIHTYSQTHRRSL